MECTTYYWPSPQCTHYGKHGFDAHLVRRGTDRGIPRLLCTMCKGTFSRYWRSLVMPGGGLPSCRYGAW